MHHEWLRLLQLLLQLQLQLLLVSDISRLGGKILGLNFPAQRLPRKVSANPAWDGDHLFVCRSSRDMGEQVFCNTISATCWRRASMSVHGIMGSQGGT